MFFTRVTSQDLARTGGGAVRACGSKHGGAGGRAGGSIFESVKSRGMTRLAVPSTFQVLDIHDVM